LLRGARYRENRGKRDRNINESIAQERDVGRGSAREKSGQEGQRVFTSAD